MKKILIAMASIGLGIGVVNAAPGPYVGIQGGIGGMDTKDYSEDSDPYNSMSLREGISYRASGGYLWGDSRFNYGFELGYASYPKNEYTMGDIKETYTGNYIDLLGVAKYSFSEDDNGFYVIGKLGLARVSQKFEGEVYGTTIVDQTEDEVKPEASVGAGYNFNKNLSLDLSYQHIFAGQADPNADTESAMTEVSSVNTLMLGLTYHFS